MKNLISPEVLAEFQLRPVPFERMIAFLNANPSVTAATLCKLSNIPVQKLYNWRNEQRKRDAGVTAVKQSGFDVVPQPESGRYSAADKLSLAKEFGKLEGEKRAELLRKFGLYQSDIHRWQTSADQAALESLGQRKTRSDKQSNESKLIEALRKDLANRDRKIEKLETLVMIQKKLSALLSDTESI